MTGTPRKWLLGCGIGCGVLILIAIALGTGGYLVIRGFVRDADRVGARLDRLDARFGRVHDFTPAPDGSLAPERIEAFLAVREDTAERRAELEGILADLAGRGLGPRASPLTWLRILRGASRALPRLFDYHEARAEALLAAGIGLGEYVYLYALVYYAWLGRSPADGPPFPLVGGDEERVGEGTRDWDWDRDEDEVREWRREWILEQMNRHLRPVLRNQLATLESGGGAAADPAWRRQLAAEVDAMAADRHRIPWRDGLPARTADCLEPFRERLAASYSELCNPAELAVRQHD
jgi:hypothetical protein